jgi:hypothetical protein
MNLNAGELLKPVFDFLDEVIADYGVYLYLVLVWLSLILIAWILSGGLRRKSRHRPHMAAGIGIVILPPPRQEPPPPLIILHEYDQSQNDDDGF